MSDFKRLIPSFGCREGQAVVRDYGQEYYSDDIMALARYYSDNGADEIFIHDLSKTEEDHQHTIDIIKQVCREIDAPVITGGRVRRLEDVKKYLYTGAKAVFLDMGRDDNLDLLKEASDRFGEEKIYAYLPNFDYVGRVEEFALLGASMMVLDVPELNHRQLHAIASLGQPFLVSCDDDVAGTITSYLKVPAIAGVILTVPGEGGGNCMQMKQQLKARGLVVDTFESRLDWEDFKLDPQGLMPVVVQDYRTQEVLMVAYMNKEAFYETLNSGKMNYFSRSRHKQWLKGETSGHFQYLKSLSLDCDQDTLLAKVHQIGPACHTGARSCFFQALVEKECKETNPLKVFQEVYGIILDRKEHPKEGSYTNYLFDKGIDKILKKLGEEATEIIIAAKNPDPEEVKYEISDLLYHVMVLMADKGVSWEDITRELANR